MSYKNGATILESILCGAFSAICTTTSISNLANFSGPALDLATNAFVDLVFGTGYNSMAAATFKTVTDNTVSQPNSPSKANASTNSTSVPTTSNLPCKKSGSSSGCGK